MAFSSSRTRRDPGTPQKKKGRRFKVFRTLCEFNSWELLKPTAIIRIMRPRKQKISKMFSAFAADLTVAHPHQTSVVVCPLCLREFDQNRIGLLSVEHAIPSELGGRVETLTCTECNNQHGSKLDSHLVSAMKAMDGLEGLAHIKAKMYRGGHISMNLNLTKGTSDSPITMTIVEKASRKSAVESLYATTLKDGDELKITGDFGFIPDRYWKAVIRSAYLSVFDVERYEYLFSEGAAMVRKVLDGHDSVESCTITGAYPDWEPPSDALIMPSRFEDIGDYYAVLLRLRSARTRYLCAFLPGKQGNEWCSLKPISDNASRIRIETTPVGSKDKLVMRLDTDPVAAFRRFRIPTQVCP